MGMPLPTVLFAGHDPGSLNHVRPIAEVAIASGLVAAAPVVDLRSNERRKPWGGVDEAREILLRAQRNAEEASTTSWLAACVTGISTNQAETAMATACAELGIPFGLMCDFSLGHRLEALPDPGSKLHLLMTTNPSAVRRGHEDDDDACVGARMCACVCVLNIKRKRVCGLQPCKDDGCILYRAGFPVGGLRRRRSDTVYRPTSPRWWGARTSKVWRRTPPRR